MKILLLAPHPFYQERGTPIAVDLVLRVLSEAGHEIHVVTLHEGEDRAYPGVTLHRIPSPPGVRNVPPGFSWKKVVCDTFLGFAACALARRLRPDLVHAVEESALLAWTLRLFFRIPYVYDMDSSLPGQLVEKSPWLKILAPTFRWFERRMVRGAVAVVPVCPALEAIAAGYNPERIVLLPDISLLAEQKEPSDAASELDGVAGIRFMYVGNLERYQGVDLMIRAFAHAAERGWNASLVIIGGTEGQIRDYRGRCRGLGIGDRVHFTGPRPVSELASWLEHADVLLSPRVTGVNTPMKVYSYLASGKPLLATRLPTHTQVLTERIAALADPDPRSFGDAMHALAADPALRERIGDAGKAYAQAHHSFPAFRQTLAGLYRDLAAQCRTSSG